MIGELIRIRYEIIGELTSSPIFDSFVARDRVRNMDVCIRLVNKPFSDEPDFVQALAAVVERTKTLDHPNIARVFEMDEHDGRPFLVCELIRGATLAEKIRRVAPFSPAVACELCIGICEALEHAAMKGIPHGDLCSDHVITSLEGRVAVIDFGLWQSYSCSRTAGAVVLSRMAPYLAPEVIDGAMPTPASDVYSAGVILFELLTGRLPFLGQTTGSTLAKQSTQPLPRVRSLNPSVPQALDEIVAKATAKDRIVRYPSPTALLSHLEALRDALRFGKHLSWPISREGQAGAVPPPAKTFAEKRKERRLGPLVHMDSRAGAVREQKPEPKPAARTKEAVKDDVPWWLKAVVYMFSGMLILFVVGWMFMNISKKKEVDVPNLIGVPLVEARQKAKAMGVDLAVGGEEYNDRFPQPQTIIEMDPAPGTPVREGSDVRVKLSLGSMFVEVPDIRGMTLAEAQRRLKAAQLQLDPSQRQESDRNIPEGMVIRTEPQHGERVERNTRIEVTLSTGRKRAERQRVSTEDLIPNFWTLRFRVQDSDEPVLVRVEMTDARREPKTVFEETREGGDEVVLERIEGYGMEATFRIYFNGYLDTTIKRKGTGP